MSNGGDDQSAGKPVVVKVDFQRLLGGETSPDPNWRPWHTCEDDAAYNDEWDDALSSPDHAVDDPFHVTRKYGIEVGEADLAYRYVNECSHMCHPGIPGAPGDAAHYWPGAMQGDSLWSYAYYCGYCAELDLDLAMPKPSHYTARNAPPWLRGLLQLGSMVAQRLSPSRPGSDWFAAALAALSDPRSWPDPPDLDATSPTGPARLTACLAIAPAAPPVCADLALAA